jgi:RNA polymerase sigma factor (TIGR02999 family)
MIHSFLTAMPTRPTGTELPGDVTVLLQRIAAGESAAYGQLIDLIYPDLKRIAELRMRSERIDHTLQPSALVNEFFLEMARDQAMGWRDRAHFLAVASQAMRRFLIDHARAHNAQRRGGKQERVLLQDAALWKEPVDAVVMGDLLERLASEEPRMAKVVDMRCFGGLTHAEIGEVLGIDERTAKRDWQVARAWLKSHLEKRPVHP